MDHLPGEVLLLILSFLEPAEITNLQLVSRGFYNLARDNSFWRARCLEESTFLENLDRRRRLFGPTGDRESPPRFLSGSGSNGSPDAGAALANNDAKPTTTSFVWKGGETRERERVRIMANWDPCFPSERVSWYDEYVQRHGPIAINWMQYAYEEGRDPSSPASVADMVEARGVALYYPDGEAGEAVLAVSPLDDGSVAMWDVGGTMGKRGALVARSRRGILFVDGPEADNRKRSKRIDSGVTECVSVDSRLHRAFFAVQSRLIEVDLRRLSVVGCESFPWSITALSAASPTVPLTVGTNLGIHLHDYRARKPRRNDQDEMMDDFDRIGANEFYERSLRRIFDDEPLPPYAPLSQPGPLSILHLQQPGQEADISDDIYVAGRFSNILHYDRRKFPSIRGSIHSGARLCAMTSLPYPFSTVDSELRRKAALSLEQVEASKTAAGGRTLIACGEYNTKGSLELYGLTPTTASTHSTSAPGGLQNSAFKNRQNCSRSKLMSVVNHGTRIAFSDGSGFIKWFERDGFTEVRRCRIGHSERNTEEPSIFSSMPGSDDIARKLLPTRPAAAVAGGGHEPEGDDGGGGGDSDNNGERRRHSNDLLFWTGEKLGLVTFSARPGFAPEDFEESTENGDGPEAKALAAAQSEYNEMMRRALERQADDVRFVRNLGLDSGLHPTPL
ncbi:hypothetical protein MYCTH_2294446 [Thermothelomyces thermophilus ATCC 42464]|uniref:F-box domain-containing protein n=1 Tax=Thermothelomyces thermophilus (strain ATCC 42464 / BCRC 31852 / DSM 1799) TaxID=573729 RepID=G2Q1B5_THET4|nr:uncharacterized protein MYCTH_2294446 [Thermothelomyces thermophilus ATCC 42464]AEO53307.1 hypothetical protein MYCTH_2294446 [Thermothelomyces thermophilus ATCC 42464]